MSTINVGDHVTTVPVGGVLTPKMERFIRVGSVGTALIIAASAMLLSYSGLHDLALDAEIKPELAILVPVMVDGLQFVGSLGVVYSTLMGLKATYPWCLMLMGVTVSAVGNWQASPADDLTAQLLHASAPIILALVLEELLRVMRHKVHLHAVAARAAQESPGADSVVGGDSVAEVVGGGAVSRSNLQVQVEREGTVGASPAQTPAVKVHENVKDPEPLRERIPGEPAALSSVTAPEALVVDETAAPTTHPELAAIPGRVSGDGVGPAVETAVVSPVAHQTGTPALSPDQSTTESLPLYPKDGTFREQIEAILAADPEITAAKIARVMGRDKSHTTKTVKSVRDDLARRAATQDDAAATTATQTPRDGSTSKDPEPTSNEALQSPSAVAPAPDPAPVQGASVATRSYDTAEWFSEPAEKETDPFAQHDPVTAGV